MTAAFSASDFWAVAPGDRSAQVVVSAAKPASPTILAAPGTAIVQEEPMAQYITIPVADGRDLSNARIHDGALLSDLNNETGYVCYRLSEASARFTPSAQSDLLAEGQAVHVALDDEAYELTVPTGAAMVKINGVEYAFNTADVIGKPPLILGTPTVVGGMPATAGPISYKAAAFLYDPSGGKPEILLRTVRDGAIRAQGDGYTLTDLDMIAGISAQQDVVNAYGVSTIETELLAPRAYSAPALVFDGSQRLDKADGIQAGSASSILIAVNLTGYTRRAADQTLFYSYDTRNAANATLPRSGTDRPGRLTLLRAGGAPIINFKTFIPADCAPLATDRLLVLIQGHVDGTWSYNVCLNGISINSQTEKLPTSGALSTATAWLFGANAGSGGLIGSVNDFRVWTDIPGAAVDTTARINFGNFIHANGLAKDPEIANRVYGTPRIWLPLNASEANARINRGTAGNFTALKGVFA